MSSTSTGVGTENGFESTGGASAGIRELAPAGEDLQARVVFDAVRQGLFPEQAPPRQQVGRFVLEGRLGAGGMGVVFAAWDPQLDRKVALKILKSPDAGSRASSRLLREARALAKLRHPNVVAVHEVGLHGDEVFIAMDFIEGCTLRQWLKSPRAWREIVELFIAAGRGLAAAHDVGLVHRDFKPDNVLIDAHGTPYVADFGVARMGRESERQGEPTNEARGFFDSTPSMPDVDSPLTEVGAVVGTPAYMAPEQLDGRPVDARSDQFSYCATLYEALFGIRPYASESLAELIDAIERHALAQPDDTRSVPRWLRRAVVRGLAVRPEDRFGSLHELLDVLESGRRRRVRWIALGAATAGAIAATTLWTAFGSTPGIDCDGGQDRLGALWNPARQATLQTAFGDSAVPFADHAWDRAHQALDAYGREWLEMRREACVATHVRGEQSAETLEARTRCLDRRLAELDGLLTVFETADAKVVERAAQAARDLTPISACADVETLARIDATSPLPEDPRQRERVQQLREQLARLRALQNTGRFEVGLEQARSLLEEALTLGYPPSIGDANYRLASFLAQTGDPMAAERHLEAAFMTALAGGDDLTAAGVSSTAAHVVGVVLRRQDEGERWARIAVSLTERLGNPPGLAARAAQQAGSVALQREDFETARAAMERAIEAFGEAGLEGDRAETTANLAILERRVGNHELALRRFAEADALMVAFYGAQHPRMVTLWNNRAAVHIATQQWDDAQVELIRAIELMKRLGHARHPSLGHPTNNLGEVYAARGEHEQAIRQFDEALEIWQATLGPEHPLVAHALTERSLSRTALGRQAEALEDARRALELRGDAHDDPKVARSRLALALALPSTQRDEARAQMLQARAVFEARDLIEPLERANAWLASTE
mgnify:CR=1 FL=1